MSQAATKESLAGKIVALNEQFLEHVQRAFARNSASLWLDAVADYREYAEAIAKELDKVPAAAPKAPVAEPNNIKPAFNFSSQPVSTTGFGWSSGAPASAAPATAPATAPASAPASAPATAPSAANTRVSLVASATPLPKPSRRSALTAFSRIRKANKRKAGAAAANAEPL